MSGKFQGQEIDVDVPTCKADRRGEEGCTGFLVVGWLHLLHYTSLHSATSFRHYPLEEASCPLTIV